jgi:hypothetical protein
MLRTISAPADDDVVPMTYAARRDASWTAR